VACICSNRAFRNPSVRKQYKSVFTDPKLFCAPIISATDTVHINIKKSVPLQAWSGLRGSRELRFPDFMTTAQDGDKAVSLTHGPPSPPGNTTGTHFCKRLSRPHGHSAIGRILCQ